MARKKTDAVEETNVATSTTEENNTDMKAILEQMKAMQAQIAQLQRKRKKQLSQRVPLTL